MPDYTALSKLFQPAITQQADRSLRRDEMARNLSMQKSNPRYMTGATDADLANLDADIAEDPQTGVKARAYTDKVTSAQQAGNIYDMPESRQMRDDTESSALKKLLLPEQAKGQNALALEHERGQNDYAKQGLANKGALDVAGAKATTGAGGKVLPSGLMERVASGSEGLAQLSELRGMLPNVSTGPLMGRLQGWAQDMPGLPADANFSKFKATSAALANSVIKAITGAQMSQTEVPRIMAQVPTEKDKQGGVWESKADALEKITRGLNLRISLLNKGVPAELLNTVSVDHLGELGSEDEAMQLLQGGGSSADDLGADWGR